MTDFRTVPAPASTAEHAYLAAIRGEAVCYQPLNALPSDDWIAARIDSLREQLKSADEQSAKGIRHELAILGGLP